MSLSTVRPIEPVLVYDPRLNFDEPLYYAVLKGSQNTTYKKWVPSSISNENITFNATPPSGGGSCMDRRVFIQVPVRVKLTFNAANGNVPFHGLAGGGARLPNGVIGPRGWGLSKSISSIRCSINNIDITANLGDYMNAIEQYIDRKVCHEAYSMTATTSDKFEFSTPSNNINGLSKLNNNPLNLWGNGDDEYFDNGRGGFCKFRIAAQTAATVAANDAVTYLDMVMVEPIILSPHNLSNKTNGVGFYNVASYTLSLNFYSGAANRMIEYMYVPYTAANIGGNRVTDGELRSSLTTYTFNNFSTFGGGDFSFPNDATPLLYINYLLPPSRLGLNQSTITQYPYFQYVLETTPINFAVGNVPIPAVPTPVTVTSNNFQLSSIPRRVYIWANPTSATYTSTPCIPDTFLAMRNIRIQFENSQNILSECGLPELYQLCIHNGYTGSYDDFTKGPVYYQNQTIVADTILGALTPPALYLKGPVMCFEFGTQIQLQSENEAPGSLSGKQYNFQVTADVISPAFIYNDAINIVQDQSVGGYGPDQVPNLGYQLCCLFSYEGIFNVNGIGNSSTNINILSEADCINAQRMPGISYNDVQAVQGGAVNFSNMRDITRNIAQGAKKFNQYLKDNKAISRAADTIADIANVVPLPYAQQGSTVARDVASLARNLGYGSGGVLLGTGGAYAKKSNLKKKLAR